MKVVRSSCSLVFFAATLLPAGTATAVAAADAHRNGIVWLETNQNSDGLWGSGLTRPVATAEALLALAKAGRGKGPAAQKAAAWLLTRSPRALDHRARAVRALAAGGFSTGALAGFGSATAGWGPVAPGPRRKSNHPVDLAYVDLNVAWSACLRGDCEQALDHASEMLVIAERFGAATAHVNNSRVFLGSAQLLRGAPRDAIETLEEITTPSGSTDPRRTISTARWARRGTRSGWRGSWGCELSRLRHFHSTTSAL